MKPRPDAPEELLERAKKVAQEAEVFYLHHWEEPVAFEANRLKLVERRESSGLALRIIEDRKIGFFSTTNLKDVTEVLEGALELVPFGPPAALTFPSHHTFPTVEVYDDSLKTFPVEQMIHLGQTMIDKVRAHTPDLLCEAGVTKGVTTLRILNSRGGEAQYTKSGFSMSVEGTLVKDTDMLFVWEGQSSCKLLTDISPIVRSMEEQLDNSRTIAPAPAGEVPVVFTPHGVAGMLLWPLLAGFNGKSILQKTSPLVGKQGEKLLDESFTLRDAPTIPFASGSRICDDEGVPTRDLTLVDHGVIGDFLFDLQTAALAGTQSTASAHRGLHSLPSPGASVLTIQEGDADYQEMLTDMKSGLVVERLLGAGQSNVLGGDFSANVLLGYRVDGGKIVGRVKNTLISGNVYKALKNLRGVGRESRWVGGWLRTPPLYCGGVAVATKG